MDERTSLSKSGLHPPIVAHSDDLQYNAAPSDPEVVYHHHHESIPYKSDHTIRQKSSNEKVAYDPAHSKRSGRILGLTPWLFWLLILGIVLTLAAGIGAGLGVGLSNSRNTFK